jgi:endonuclease/exonuclease/phosphatase family metal-dependent hydrolase
MAANTLTFAWWNVCNFAHFDTTKAGKDRWPSSRDEFEAKAQRIASVLNSCFRGTQGIDVIALGEVTKGAAEFLRNHYFTDHEAYSLDLTGQPSFQVAVLYRRDLDVELGPPVIPPFMPRGTRPAAELDWIISRHRVRFVAVHWQSRRGVTSTKYRSQVAAFLGRRTYRFLNHARATDRHVVIMGDFNAEPFDDELCDWLNATRSRVEARRPHWSDTDTHRARLYNVGWRLVGETRPYDSMDFRDSSVAGTYYYHATNTWHTFDQLIVSSGLISNGYPYLIERYCRVIDARELLDSHGRPLPFQRADNGWTGCSDHLPVVAAISY